MIKKISTINNLAVFNNFEWDKAVLDKNGVPVPFVQINVLYGRNYSGKTTLSRIFRAMETGVISEKYDNPSFEVIFNDRSKVTMNDLETCNKNIRVFNEDFVRDNLRFIIDPDGVIQPFAILGDDNNVIEKEIGSLESELGIKENGKETGLYAQLKIDSHAYKIANDMFKQADDRLDRLKSDKATNRTTGIKYKPDRFGDQNYTKAKLESDIQKVLSDPYVPIDENKKAELEKTLNEQAKPTLPTFPQVKLSWQQLCSRTDELLNRPIGSSDKIVELISDVALNEWVKRGCELHREKRSKCAFCGNDIEAERWELLYRHFDEESMILENDIEELIKNIEDEAELVIHGFNIDRETFYSKYWTDVNELSQLYETVSNKYVTFSR